MRWSGSAAMAGARIKTLSGGQKRRLEVALGIVGNPDLIFLEQPLDWLRPLCPPSGVGAGAEPAQPWHNHTAHHALHGRGPESGRQHRRDRQWPDRGTLNTSRPSEAATASTPASDSKCPRASRPVMGPTSASSAAEVDERAFEVSTGDPTRILSDHTGWALARRCAARRAQLAPPSLEEVYLELTEISIGIGRRSDG